MKIIALIMLSLGIVSGQTLEKLASIRLPKGAGEILAVDPKLKLLVTTRHGKWARGLEILDLSDIQHPKRLRSLSLKKAHPHGMQGVSSVAIDPLGRGMAAAAIIPKHPTRDRGIVALIDLRTRKIISTHWTGYHPDCVVFSPDGRYLTVACEGEHLKGERQTPGSLTVLDLSKTPITSSDSPLRRSHVRPGVRLPHTGTFTDLEPEYVTIQGSTAYVTLQENNAVGTFDLGTRRWRNIRPLGNWKVRLDPSDRDGPDGGPKVDPSKVIHALPLPDTLTSFRWKGRTYLATANEGDDAGAIRMKKLGKGDTKLDPRYRKRLHQRFGVDPQNDAVFGRLKISPIDGDLDGDGDIDRLMALGTRSFSIWDAASGKRLYDSGSLFADISLRDPATFNVNDGKASRWDTRSDNHGAEPEAIYASIIGGRPLLAIATERQNGVYLFNCSNPRRPRLVSALNELRAGHFAPESVLLLPAKKSPTSTPLCLVGWEGSSTVTVYAITK